MQAVLPLGAFAVLAVGVVMMGIAFDTPEKRVDRGAVSFRHAPGPDGTTLVVRDVQGSPSWLDVNAHTVDGFPIPHRWTGHDEYVHAGESLVLTGKESRHDNATITYRGDVVYTLWGLV